MTDSVSGSEAINDSVSGVSGTQGTGGDQLFQFDPMDVLSRRRRNKKLEAMKCWPQVKHMLDNGVPIPEIVHYIQVTRKEYTEVKPNSLRVMINQWLGNLSNRNRLIDHRIPVRHLNLINSNKERIDPQDAMNMLFALQMDRILMSYEKEKSSKKLDKENTASLKLAMEMINSLHAMQANNHDPRLAAALKQPNSATTLEAGMNGTLAQMDRIKAIFEQRWGATAAAVLLDAESRNKLFNAVKKIRGTSGVAMSELIQKNTIEAAAAGGNIIEVSGNDADATGEIIDQ